MTKNEVLKALETMKNEADEYSNYALRNSGYREAIMDATDLVKKLTIPVVVRSVYICQCKYTFGVHRIFESEADADKYADDDGRLLVIKMDVL